MCNLYPITTNQEAIRALFRVMNRYVANLPPVRRDNQDGNPATIRMRMRRCWGDEGRA
jgi:hypothetical protein